jgi:hypothetical protein
LGGKCLAVADAPNCPSVTFGSVQTNKRRRHKKVLVTQFGVSFRSQSNGLNSHRHLIRHCNGPIRSSTSQNPFELC